MSDKKTLKIRRVLAWSIFSNLKKIAPKDYPTTAEIKSTINDILPALKESVSFYSDTIKKAEDIQEKIIDKKITEEESKAEVEKLNIEWKDYNKNSGLEVVDINLDEEAFKTLKAQFERDNWGKSWMLNIEEFGELLEAFNEAGK